MARDLEIRDNEAYRSLQPYGVLLGTPYNTFKDAVKAQLAQTFADSPDGVAGSASKTKADEWIAKDTQTDGLPSDKTVYQFNAPSVSDASVGGNDAINPLPAFGLDDDIVHNIYTTRNSKFGMGRCYSEMIDSNQVIVYLTMGVPRYKNLTTWLKNACDKSISELNDEGRISMWTKLKNLFTSALVLAIELPWLPIIWSARLIKGIKDYKVTEYFYFRDTMPLYYRYVNTLMSHLAVEMGIYGNGASNGANVSPEQMRLYQNNAPAILKNGPDIFKIISRRSERLGNSISESTDSLLEKMKAYNQTQLDNADAGALSNFWTGLTMGALEGANFLGFRINRTDASENISNSTQDSSLLSKLNGEVQKRRDSSLGANGGGTGALAWTRRYVDKATNAAKALKGLMTGNIDGTIAYMASGNGFFDLPKEWSGSSGMGKSISLNFKLRAYTGGDNVSIFQNVMIPLCCILSAALPRAAGDSTYTAPFIVRAFCKGLFAIPAGIITSVSITRGAAEFGWSVGRVPTVIDVSVNIDDLSPMLYLSMAGDGVFAQAFANNTKLHEYLNTLSGIGLRERYFRMGQLKRRVTAAWLIKRNTTFNPVARGYFMGDNSVVRTVMAFTPFHRVKNN